LTKLKQKSRIHSLYKRYIENRFSPAQGERNTHLIQMTTFLFYAVGEDTLMELVGAYFDLNQDIFLDSREQHIAEASAHLRACQTSWVRELSTDIQKDLLDLPSCYQEAFRICSDLAKFEDKNFEPHHFFLSRSQLADRIGIEPHEAKRILLTFINLNWMSLIAKGSQRSSNSPGKANTYQWLLPIAALLFFLSMHRIFYLFFF
jgi:hypothetical protein